MYVSWTVPKNFSVYEISHFKVYLNGTHMENETLKNKAVIMKAYQVCTCDVTRLVFLLLIVVGMSARVSFYMWRIQKFYLISWDVESLLHPQT